MFKFYLVQWTKALLLPPLIFIWLLILGLILHKKKPAIAKKLIISGMLGTLLCSIPLVSSNLLSTLENYPALTVEQIQRSNARAIVLLGGGAHRSAPEYNGENISRYTLERMQYAVNLHHLTKLPILITGGAARDGFQGEANTMARVLEDQFAIKAKWIDNQAVHTADNAANSAKLLHQSGINEILLVTHALHMPRAHTIFARQGFQITAAPTGFMGSSKNDDLVLQLKPGTQAWQHSYQAFHEYLGRIWYAIKY